MHTVNIDHMDLNQIAESGQCFRWQKLNDNTYKIPAFNKELIITQDGTSFTLSCDEIEWDLIWKKYFDVDTDTDYGEVERIVAKSNDEFLQKSYQYGKGIRILRQDLWETIISFIISQNNNIPRIKKSIEKLCNETKGEFPTYSDLLDMDLSNKGLGYRDDYIKSAVKWWMYLDTDRLYRCPKEYLMEVKGIGNKVSDCICLFGLHQLDAFPIDTHIRRIIDREYNGELPEWSKSKYAGLLQQYVFYYELNHRTNGT